LALDILVVDDHYANRLLAKTLLVRQGHSVTLANNGQMCLDICAKKSFDVIILDIQMPIMDGLTALKHLRQNKTTCPVFALTAYCEPKDVKAYLSAGFNTVLTKPLKQNDIEQAWETHKLQSPQKPQTRRDEPVRTSKTVIQPITNMPDHIALLDTEIVDELCKVLSQTNRRRLLKTFYQEISGIIDQMYAQADLLINSDTDSLSQFRKNAHSIKGTSINIGALRTSRLAAQLQNSPIEHIPSLLDILQRSLKLTYKALYKRFGIKEISPQANHHHLPATAAR